MKQLKISSDSRKMIELFINYLDNETDNDISNNIDNFIKENKKSIDFEICGMSVFPIYENGDTVVRLIRKNLLDSGDCKNMTASFDNDEGVYIQYKYDGDILYVKGVYGGERIYIDECESCDKSLGKKGYSIYTYDENKEYICPRCGADLKEYFKPDVIYHKYKIIDGEWFEL